MCEAASDSNLPQGCVENRGRYSSIAPTGIQETQDAQPQDEPMEALGLLIEESVVLGPKGRHKT